MTALRADKDHDSTAPERLALRVGCEFELTTYQSVAAIVQVAPFAQRTVSIRREQWDSTSEHHGYLDSYGNRCERFALAAGASRIAYEAELLLASAADLIEPETPETPVVSLPDEVLNFVIPSRFCLPDELPCPR